MLMSYTTPEDSFVIMVALMQNYGIKECFLPEFPGLKKYYYIFVALMKKYMPKLFNRLKEAEMIGQLYALATQWFPTLFVVYFPIDIVVRIWDMYLIEGRKTLFRVALAIMKINQKEILEEESEDMLYMKVQTGHKNVKSFEQLQKAMLSYTFSHKLIDFLEYEYNKQTQDGQLEVSFN